MTKKEELLEFINNNINDTHVLFIKTERTDGRICDCLFDKPKQWVIDRISSKYDDNLFGTINAATLISEQIVSWNVVSI